MPLSAATHICDPKRRSAAQRLRRSVLIPLSDRRRRTLHLLSARPATLLLRRKIRRSAPPLAITTPSNRSVIHNESLAQAHSGRSRRVRDRAAYSTGAAMDVILTGTVTSQTNSQALVNARVEAWDSAPGALRPIAMGPVKSGGAFAVVVPDRAPTAIADRVIELRVVYQGALLRLTQPLTWRSGQKADGLQLIAAVDARGRDVAGARSVSGRVTQIASGRAVAGVLVRAFDRDLRAEPLLGEAHTGADGRYSLVYYGAALSRPGKAAANLF